MFIQYAACLSGLRTILVESFMLMNTKELQCKLTKSITTK